MSTPHVLGTAVLPWTSDWQLDTERFRRQIVEQVREGITDLYIFGTAGEGYAVTDQQFLDIARLFADAARSVGVEPMVGVIHLSLATMVERVTRAREIGVRRFQISMPSWGALSEREAGTFFEELLGSFRDCEFLHYNVARSKRQLSGREYAELASRHPNLVATKQSTDSMKMIAESMELAPGLRHYFVDGGFAYGSMFGECGLIPSLAACNFDRLRDFVEAGAERDIDRLLLMQGELRDLIGGILEAAGDGNLIDGAYEKIVRRLHDPEFPLRMLPPYASARPDAAERFREWLERRSPDWVPA